MDSSCIFPGCDQPPGGLYSLDLCRVHYRKFVIWETDLPIGTIDIDQVTGTACRRLPNPCPSTLCRYRMESDEGETCVKRIAESGSMTLEQVGVLISVTRERVRQIEKSALIHLRRRSREFFPGFLD